MSGKRETAAPVGTADLRERVGARMAETGLSQSALAGALGLGKTVVSLWFSEKYTGDNGKVDAAMLAWLEREEANSGSRMVRIPLVETDVTRRIGDLALLCHTEGEIAVAYGDAGVGKTTAAKIYTKENPGTILVEADMGYTARTLMTVLSRELSLPEKGTIHDLFEGVKARLLGSGRVVIVDEAEHLPYKALELLRRLHDKAGIGVLLIGMPRLLANLRGNRGEFAQLFSRVASALKMEGLELADTRLIAAGVGIEDMAPVKALHAHCRGNARILTKLLKASVRVARTNGIAVSAEVVESAAGMLMV
jgi:DNA transposition AAA+ family ATPase